MLVGKSIGKQELSKSVKEDLFESIVGAIYTDVKAPVAASSGGGSRVGVATSTTYLGLIATGDASIATAKRNGGISSVSSVDEEIKSVLGIITTYKTTVRGN